MVHKGSGIYKISYGDECYYGQTVSFQNRWIQHRKNLKAGIHSCKRLQEIYDDFGLEALEFSIVKELDPDFIKPLNKKQLKPVLKVMEQVYLTCFDNINFYKVACSPLGSTWNEEAKKARSILRTGTKHTEETKEKIRQSKLGKKRDPETIAKFSEGLAKGHYFYHSEKGDLYIKNLKKYCRDNKLNSRGLYEVLDENAVMYKNHFKTKEHYERWLKKKNSIASVFIGVTKNSKVYKNKYWRASVKYTLNIDGIKKRKTVNLGSFENEHDAAEVALIGRQIYL